MVGAGGRQAVAQTVLAARAAAPSPPTTTTGAAAPSSTTAKGAATPVDSDHDGTPDSLDCAPNDPSIHPGAADLPDLKFVGSNCDGIDGTVADAVFVSPSGDDANRAGGETEAPGPGGDLDGGGGNGSYVLVADGTYQGFQAGKRVEAVFGGYDPKTWKRSAACCTTIAGSPEGVVAQGVKRIAPAPDHRGNGSRGKRIRDSSSGRLGLASWRTSR